MIELYFYIFNKHSINNLVVCIPNNGEEYIEDTSINSLRSDAIYVSIEDYLKGLL